MPNKPLELVDSKHPIYRKLPFHTFKKEDFKSTTNIIRLQKIAIPSYSKLYNFTEAASRFDARAAAAISAAAGYDDSIQLGPTSDFQENNLLQVDKYDHSILIPTAKCAAVLGLYEYFPALIKINDLRPLVSQAILSARPGWCGSFGAGATDLLAQIFTKVPEGNYEMSQMHLLQIAYRFYDPLTIEARDRLINVLLATGRIHRPNEHDIVTSGSAPVNYSSAGFFTLPGIGGIFGIHPKIKRIGETENHILLIHTARYLTNQLLYQQDHNINHDNRRNGPSDKPELTCMRLMLNLLGDILRDDFSEYNAKNYQHEVRYALLNLCSYSYDHEVRLAARLVLDYISAHMAVSSNDLRRMIPFRRRNQEPHSARNNGFMEVGLIQTSDGGDPMAQHFAILAGNTRTYSRTANYFNRPEDCIDTSGENGNEAVADALSDYRLPPLIHDLFMNDRSRYFYQRLHRIPMGIQEVTGRNCENYEIYASSPSYLITAGGSPATYAIDPYFGPLKAPDQDQQLGVALTTSFMPTGTGAGKHGDITADLASWHTTAKHLIQFGHFSQEEGEAANYGVAPDFVCGHRMYYPPWCPKPGDANEADRHGQFHFVNRGGDGKGPGFFLAICDANKDGVIMEAFDNWLHPEVSFEQFKRSVIAKNGGITLKLNSIIHYTTYNGNLLQVYILDYAATILSIIYSDPNGPIAKGDACNITGKFLNGTILNSETNSGVIRISNPNFSASEIILNMSDVEHPKRISETGEVEEAGYHNEVWVDFNWAGENAGDFFRPFNNLSAAISVVAENGVIKIKPGFSLEQPLFVPNKRYRIEAPIGGVAFGYVR